MQEKALPSQASEANIQRVLAMLRLIPIQLESIGNQLEPAELEQPLAADEWSPQRVLAHLVHCEARSLAGISHALLLSNPPHPRIHAERQLGKLLRYEQFSYAELLVYFSLRRRALLAVLERLKAQQWLRTVQPVGKQRPENVYYLARALALHETEHLRDMRKKLAPRLSSP